jgi:hypothetical protein
VRAGAVGAGGLGAGGLAGEERGHGGPGMVMLEEYYHRELMGATVPATAR